MVDFRFSMNKGESSNGTNEQQQKELPEMIVDFFEKIREDERILAEGVTCGNG